MALTGFLSGGVCYTSLIDAQDAFFSAYQPVFFPGPVSGQFYQVSYWKGVNGWSIRSLLLDGQTFTSQINLQSSVNAGAFDKFFPACDPALMPLSLHDIFTIPAGPDVATVWGFAFVIPITLYLASWAYGTLNGMFKHRPDDD